MEFRNKYKIPLFLEESLSFGVLGRTGKGAAEHFNIPVCIFETSWMPLICVIGYFFAGRWCGYCLCLPGHSSSKCGRILCWEEICHWPPTPVRTGLLLLRFCATHDGSRCYWSPQHHGIRTRQVCQASSKHCPSSPAIAEVGRLRYGIFVTMKVIHRCKGVVVCGDKLSPVVHLRPVTPISTQDDYRLLSTVADRCIEQGVAVVTAKFLPDEMTTPPSR